MEQAIEIGQNRNRVAFVRRAWRRPSRDRQLMRDLSLAVRRQYGKNRGIVIERQIHRAIFENKMKRVLFIDLEIERQLQI